MEAVIRNLDNDLILEVAAGVSELNFKLGEIDKKLQNMSIRTVMNNAF
jgi:hypothetical protein